MPKNYLFQEDPVVIVSVARTPIGAMMGELSTFCAPELGSISIQAAIERVGIAPQQIDEVFMGCVLTAGQGQAPARQAAIKAGLPPSVGATTINKVCGSGMKAAMLAYDSIISGSQDIVVAGGMESMSNAPFLLAKARGGYRFGHGVLFDHMALDGLEDAYSNSSESGGKSMGLLAEECAEKYRLTRQEQDAFAIESTRKAIEASKKGLFEWEICPVTVSTKKGSTLVTQDESPFKVNLDRIPTLNPAFKKDGTITAATSSSISDGAAALVLMRESTARSMGIAPIARFIAHASYAHEANWFTTAPVGAIKKIYQKTGWNSHTVDLFEINEAFAVVTMAAKKDCEIPDDCVNVFGGACALGHPLGASGARIIATLLGSLRSLNKTRGIATLCIGGGEAVAVALERV